MLACVVAGAGAAGAGAVGAGAAAVGVAGVGAAGAGVAGAAFSTCATAGAGGSAGTFVPESSAAPCSIHFSISLISSAGIGSAPLGMRGDFKPLMYWTSALSPGLPGRTPGPAFF